MKQVFRVADDNDKEFEVKVSERDVLKYEQSGQSIAGLENMPMTSIYKLVYFTAHRKALVKCTYEKFEENYDVSAVAGEPGPKDTK